jgi:hypothetical protein
MTTIDFSPGSNLAVLFHKAWGQAKASPEYDKKVWIRIDKILSGSPAEEDRAEAATPRARR